MTSSNTSAMLMSFRMDTYIGPLSIVQGKVCYLTTASTLGLTLVHIIYRTQLSSAPRLPPLGSKDGFTAL